MLGKDEPSVEMAGLLEEVVEEVGARKIINLRDYVAILKGRVEKIYNGNTFIFEELCEGVSLVNYSKPTSIRAGDLIVAYVLKGETRNVARWNATENFA